MKSEEQLVKENMNLIYFVIKKMKLTSKKEDYFDLGLIGLLKGIRHYDEKKGFTLSTYLYRCIYFEILKYISSQNREIRGGGIADVSLDIEYQHNDGRKILLAETIPSKENIEKIVVKNEKIRCVKKEIKNMSERYKFIFCSYFGILGYEKLNQTQIAREVDLKQSQVSRILKKLVRKVRKNYE